MSHSIRRLMFLAMPSLVLFVAGAVTGCTNPHVEPEPTAGRPSPIPSSQPTEIPRDFILVWREQEADFLVVDPTRRPATAFSIGVPSACRQGPLPYTTWFSCEGKGTEHFLFNPLDGDRIDLPTFDGEAAGASTNGRYILYSRGANTGTKDFFSLDACTGKTADIATDIGPEVRQQWPVHPALSYDGTAIAVVHSTSDVGTYRIALALDEGVMDDLGPTSPTATWDVAWSPIGPSLLFGATDTAAELAPLSRHLYVLDTETGEYRILASSPSPTEWFGMGTMLWSPQGDRVATTLGSQACVVGVTETSVRCFDAKVDATFTPIAWSPTGTRIAFVDNSGTLIVSGLDGKSMVPLLSPELQGAFQLYWGAPVIPCPAAAGVAR